MIKRRFLAAVLALALCLSLCVPDRTQAEEEERYPCITGSEVSAAPGDTVSVVFRLLDNPGITSMTLDVTYDTSVFTLKGVRDMGLLSGASFVTSPSLNYYPYRLIWNHGTEDLAQDGILVVLSFEVDGDAEEGLYEIGVSCGEGDVYNTAMQDVDFDWEAALVDIWSGADSVPGDVDGDNDIDLADAQLALRTVLKMIPEPEDADLDMDEDGRITLEDVRIILEMALDIW